MDRGADPGLWCRLPFALGLRMIRRHPLLSVVFALHLVLSLACGRVFDRDGVIGREDDGEDGEDGPVVVPDAPVVFYVSWDEEGRTWPEELDEEAEVCPEGARYLGGNGWSTACLDSGARAAAYPISNLDHDTWPETLDDPALVCPAGWGFVGGNSWSSTCVHSAGHTSYELFYGAAGEDVAEVGVSACGPGEGLGYGYYGSAVCAVEGQRGTALLTVDAAGRTIDEVEAQELCPAGWDFLGTWWYGAAVCLGPEGTVIGLSRDAQGRTTEEVEAAALCPAGWQHLGSYSYTEYCFTAERRTVATLSRDASGRTWPEDVDSEAELCPSGWEHLGGVGYGPVCAD